MGACGGVGGEPGVSSTGSKKKAPSTRAKGGRAKGGKRPPKRPGAPKRAAEFLERLLPESEEQSGTAFADRKTRRQTAHKMGVAFDHATQVFGRIEEELDKDEESVEQLEWADRGKRRESDERARERGEDRADMRQVVWVEERRRAMRRRDVLLGLTVVTTLAAIALLYLAVEHNQVEFAGASAVSAALPGLGALFMRWIRGSQEEATAVGEAAVEPPPFRWSVLDLQPEIEEGEEEEPRQGDGPAG
jgi:hypothetical protein